ncbi:MAG: hypothetical protein K8S55_15695 [Phycisphaerae bacterium]|nr:hypothetical protein [Phycisphaerae bacterium]
MREPIIRKPNHVEIDVQGDRDRVWIGRGWTGEEGKQERAVVVEFGPGWSDGWVDFHAISEFDKKPDLLDLMPKVVLDYADDYEAYPPEKRERLREQIASLVQRLKAESRVFK